MKTNKMLYVILLFLSVVLISCGKKGTTVSTTTGETSVNVSSQTVKSSSQNPSNVGK
jgi:hypothetical protein